MTTKAKLRIDHLDGFQFEDLVARIMRKVGYHDVNVTQKTGDEGKDILMKTLEGHPVVVECKHQKTVGRPVIQKLQGAMLHEKGNSSFVKGIVVTSGKFAPTVKSYVDKVNHDHAGSMELLLIDGKELQNICNKYGVVLLNGKVQIITDNVIAHIAPDDMQNKIKEQFMKITGAEESFLSAKIKRTFKPVCRITYDINCEFKMSNGRRLHQINKRNRSIILSGSNSYLMDPSHHTHFFSRFPALRQLDPIEFQNIEPYHYTENDLEKMAVDRIIEDHTEDVHYTGDNNVNYTKTCRPKYKNVTVKRRTPMYLPQYSNVLKVVDKEYTQEIMANEDSLLFLEDEIKQCSECRREHPSLFLCKKEGKILCKSHKRLDKVDETPMCFEHAIPRRLFLQKVYFISEKNKQKYDEKWKSMNPFQKFWEDKMLVGTSSFSLVLLVIFLLSL